MFARILKNEFGRKKAQKAQNENPVIFIFFCGNYSDPLSGPTKTQTKLVFAQRSRDAKTELNILEVFFDLCIYFCDPCASLRRNIFHGFGCGWRPRHDMW
jgi:hypothetical protein